MSKKQRGQIWLVDFEPQTHVAEPGKRGRPALILQTDTLNNVGHQTTIVIPCTTQIYRDSHGDGFPLRVSLNVLGTETDLLIDQIRAISNNRFLANEPVAILDQNTMKRVVNAIKIILSI